MSSRRREEAKSRMGPVCRQSLVGRRIGRWRPRCYRCQTESWQLEKRQKQKSTGVMSISLTRNSLTARPAPTHQTESTATMAGQRWPLCLSIWYALEGPWLKAESFTCAKGSHSSQSTRCTKRKEECQEGRLEPGGADEVRFSGPILG